MCERREARPSPVPLMASLNWASSCSDLNQRWSGGRQRSSSTSHSEEERKSGARSSGSAAEKSSLSRSESAGGSPSGSMSCSEWLLTRDARVTLLHRKSTLVCGGKPPSMALSSCGVGGAVALSSPLARSRSAASRAARRAEFVSCTRYRISRARLVLPVPERPTSSVEQVGCGGGTRDCSCASRSSGRWKPRCARSHASPSSSSVRRSSRERWSDTACHLITYGTLTSPPSSEWTGCHWSPGWESSLLVPIGKEPASESARLP
mmetsp:Transcript_14664/g.43602  ORF Transcript_14664/g.43602 Transcript_14664/m.43602 type:complete len:264 (-) Transcript_14664:2808-3599(-)